MRNHNLARRVEAPRTNPEASLDELRSMGAAFERRLRELVDQMARSCGTFPHPSQLYRDNTPQRARSATMETMCAMIVGCLLCPRLTDDAFDRFAMLAYGWMLSVRPKRRLSSKSAWVSDTTVQGPTDVAQGLAVNAFETGDVVANERALEATALHLAKIRDYFESLSFEHRMLTGGATQ